MVVAAGRWNDTAADFVSAHILLAELPAADVRTAGFYQDKSRCPSGESVRKRNRETWRVREGGWEGGREWEKEREKERDQEGQKGDKQDNDRDGRGSGEWGGSTPEAARGRIPRRRTGA